MIKFLRPDKQINESLLNFIDADPSTSFKYQSEITDKIKARFVALSDESPVVKLEEDTGDYVSWEFSLAKSHFGNPVSESKTSNVATKQYDDLKIDIISKQGKLKIFYVLKKLPTPGIPLNININTSLTPVQERGKFLGKDIGIVEGTDYGDGIEDAYEKVIWLRPDGTQFGYWEPLPLWDSKGKKAKAYYRQIVDNGGGSYSLELYIDPTVLIGTEPDFTIDPTMVISGSGNPYILSGYTMYRNVGYNNNLHYAIFPTTAAGNAEFWYSLNNWSTVTQVALPSPADTHLFFQTCIDPDNGNIHIVSGQPLSGTKTVEYYRFNVSTLTFSSPVTLAASGSGIEGFSSIQVDLNGNIYVLGSALVSPPTHLHRLWESTDGGLTFHDAPDGGGVPIFDTKGHLSMYDRHSCCVDENGLIHLLFKGVDNYPYYQTYNQATNTFSALTNISPTKTTISAFTLSCWGILVDDKNSRIFAWWQDGSGNPILSKLEGGSWTELGIFNSKCVTVTKFGDVLGIIQSGANGGITRWNSVSGITTDTIFAVDDDVMIGLGFNAVPGTFFGDPIKALGAKSGSGIIYEFPSDDNLVGDDTPPVVSAKNPDNADTGVSIATSVYFEIDDDISGVDTSTLIVTIAGSNAILAGVLQPGFTGSVTPDGTGMGYDVTVNPDSDFSYGQVVSIAIDCSDIDGNPMTTVNYSFTCEFEDIYPPYGGYVSAPGNNAKTSNRPTITTAGWAGASEYKFFLSKKKDFSSDLIESDWQVSTSWLPGTLDPRTTYYVKAQARDDLSPIPNESAFTLTNRFYTAYIANHAEIAQSRILSQYKD